MSHDADVGGFDVTASDDLLAEVALTRRGEASALGALKEIVRRRSPRRFEVFGDVLADAKHDVAARRTAAAALGREPSPLGRKLLARHLSEEDPSVFARVAQSLGRVGDARTLKQLEAARPPAGDDNAARSLAFARAFLSYRLRLDRHRIERPGQVEPAGVGDVVQFSVSEAEPETTRRAIEGARDDLPTVALATEGAAELRCLDNLLLAVFADDFWRREAQETLVERSALLMVLLKYSTSTGSYFADTLFFTHPEGARRGEVAVLGVRPSEALTYSGDLRLNRDGFDLSLKSVRTRYAPAVDVAARYDAGRASWEVERALTTTAPAAGRVAAPAPKPAPRLLRKPTRRKE